MTSSFEEERPACTAEPCNDCPWRRVSVAGWLGPMTPAEWIGLAHTDEPIACHQTIQGGGDWAGVQQCRGAAVYRANIAKSPRDAHVTVGPVDRENVFATPTEFLEHHARA